MKKILTCIGIVISVSLFSQESDEIDSLRLLLNLAKEDTARVNTLNALSWKLISRGDYEKANIYCIQCIHLAEKLNFNKGLAIAFTRMGIVFENKGNYSRALEYQFRGLHLAETIEDKKVIANALNNIGNIYDYQSKYPQALMYYYMALKEYEALGNKLGEANTLNNIGIIYHLQKNNTLALEYHLKSLKIRTEIRDENGSASSYSNIGNIYVDQKEYDKALGYYENALNAQIRAGNKKQIANMYINLGSIYMAREDFKSALEFNEKALKITEEIGNKPITALALYNIGNLYYSIGQYKKALSFQKKSLETGKETGYINVVELAELSLSETYEGLHNNSEALIHYKNYTIVKDSAFNEAKSKQIAEMNFKYETEKKEKEIELLTQEKKLRETELTLRNAIIIGVILISALLFVLYNRYNIKKQFAADKQKLTVEKRLAETEQKLLRLQMNPHFIFNALTALQGFINADKKTEAGVYLSKISKLIRSILENSREDYVSLEKELKNLESYLQINRILLNDEFEYKIEIAPEIDKENTLIPPMLAQPFIENALLHGIRDKEKGSIVVRFRKNNAKLLFEVEDNGLRLSEASQETEPEHKSLATTITRERLANLFEISVDEIQINFHELKDDKGICSGTKVYFEIPVQYV